MKIEQLVKFTAIDFVEWIENNYLIRVQSPTVVNEWHWEVPYPNTDATKKQFTTDELFEIFIKSESHVDHLKKGL